ncbi:hypothetical protein SAMN02910369_01678 [Lachnospiraceae bacterium NE2001]|nr:hypothetical protein SAMN02910369_01678 [Lachnospiraceae bacterium NE2001]
MGNEIKIKKETLDSLIFFYFGFTLDEDYCDIITRIIEKAYVDATNQGAFNTIADPRKAKLSKYGKDGKGGSFKIVLDRIGILEKDEMVNFDGWHNETCNMLIKLYDKNGLKDIFTYGNAQKWINMTLKYIFLLNGISNNNAESILEKSSKICRYSSDFHIPIDSYIIDELWDPKKKVKLPVKDNAKKGRDYLYKTPSEYVKGWSNWVECDYLDALGTWREVTGINPLVWESEHWINRAKKRKRKNITNK